MKTAWSIIKKLRENFCYVFIGTNRTGKSSICRNQIIVWKRANQNKKVVAYDPQNRFKGLVDVYIDPLNEGWLDEILEMRNILLAVDDFKKLHPSSHPPKRLRELLIDFCQYNIDIMGVFHNPADVWDILNSHTTHYFIFKTNSKEGKFKEKIPNYQICTIASYKVNKYVREYGRGSYLTGCDFPYIFVDNDNEKMYAINMSNKKKKLIS